MPSAARKVSPRVGQIRKVALLMWGDVFEDFLDDIGWSVDEFCERMTGGWCFGYAEALARQSIEVVMVCVVRSVKRPERRVHGPTGMTIILLPATRSLRLSRRFLHIRYRYLAGDATPRVPWIQRLAYHLVPYLATPRRALRRMLVRERCDALMNQSYEDARFDIAVRVGTQVGIPVFVTAQGGERHRSRLERLLRPRSLARSAGVIIASRTEAQRVVQTYGLDASKIARVMNPLDDSLWFPERRPDTRDALGVPRDALLVVWHGRIDLAQKGIDVLLDATKPFASVSEHWTTARSRGSTNTSAIDRKCANSCRALICTCSPHGEKASLLHHSRQWRVAFPWSPPTRTECPTSSRMAKRPEASWCRGATRVRWPTRCSISFATPIVVNASPSGPRPA
jgi:hypothetical protein